MSPRHILPLALVLLATGSAAVSWAAPDPDSGTVSAAAPTTSFSGEITEPTGAAEILFQEQGTSKGSCDEPYCQEYALTVADPGTQLQVKSEVDEDGFSQTVEIEDPSGEITQTSAADPGHVTARIKNPAAGAWLIRIYGSDYINESPTWTYTATVTLTTATAAPPDAGPEPPAPPAPETTLTVKRGKVSARRANRSKRVAVTLTASAPVQDAQVALSTGRSSRPRLAGRTAVERLEGTQRVKVRLRRKLMRGRLTVSVRGTDEQGRAVTGSGRLRVRK